MLDTLPHAELSAIRSAYDKARKQNETAIVSAETVIFAKTANDEFTVNVLMTLPLPHEEGSPQFDLLYWKGSKRNDHEGQRVTLDVDTVEGALWFALKVLEHRTLTFPKEVKSERKRGVSRNLENLFFAEDDYFRTRSWVENGMRRNGTPYKVYRVRWENKRPESDMDCSDKQTTYHTPEAAIAVAEQLWDRHLQHMHNKGIPIQDPMRVAAFHYPEANEEWSLLLYAKKRRWRVVKTYTSANLLLADAREGKVGLVFVGSKTPEVVRLMSELDDIAFFVLSEQDKEGYIGDMLTHDPVSPDPMTQPPRIPDGAVSVTLPADWEAMSFEELLTLSDTLVAKTVADAVAERDAMWEAKLAAANSEWEAKASELAAIKEVLKKLTDLGIKI